MKCFFEGDFADVVFERVLSFAIPHSSFPPASHSPMPTTTAPPTMPASHHNHPERDERDPAPPLQPRAKAHLENWHQQLPRLIKQGPRLAEWPQTQQDQIFRCARLQEQLADLGASSKNWSDKDFTAGLEIATIWPSLRTGTYPYPSQPKTRAKWRDQLEALEQRGKSEMLRHEAELDIKAQQDSPNRFIEFSEYHAIKRGIEIARKKVSAHSEERLVVFVARTRGGKTWMGNRLHDEGILNWRVKATPAWKHSYKAMLISLCEIFGVEMPANASSLVLETLLLKHSKTLAGVVLFEEVQGLCRDSQEFIKLLLNESFLVVCVFVTNEAHTEMLVAGGNHLAQLFARAETTIRASAITADTVKAFDPALWARVADDKLLKQVAEAANALGALSCCRRVTDAVKASLQNDQIITEEILQDAINAYRRAVPVVSTAVRYRSTAKMERRAA